MQTDSRYPWGKGTNIWYRLASTNDSDVTLTVPTGKAWWIHSIHLEITTTGDAGNRALRVYVTNGTNGVWQSVQTGNIAASQTGILELQTNFTTTASSTSFPILGGAGPNVGAYAPLPLHLILNEGYTIRLWDINAVQVAADDMVIVINYTSYDV